MDDHVFGELIGVLDDMKDTLKEERMERSPCLAYTTSKEEGETFEYFSILDDTPYEEILKVINSFTSYKLILEDDVISSDNFKGFTLKKGMFIFWSSEEEGADITAISYATPTVNNQVKIFFMGETSSEVTEVYVDLEDIEDGVFKNSMFSAEVFSRMVGFEEAIEDLSKIPYKDRVFLNHAKVVLTMIEPGSRPNNGGDYGVYTVLETTSVLSIFKVYTYSTSELEEGKEIEENYVALSSEDFHKMLENAVDVNFKD